MRCIMFRIWDGKRKEWLGTSDKDSLKWYGFHLVGECMSVQAPPCWKLEEQCVVEEFTGLTDKRDKEIYEGDIIQCGENVYYTIVFSEGRFMCEGNGRCWIKTIAKEGRVVGNIHENPELLKEVK